MIKLLDNFYIRFVVNMLFVIVCPRCWSQNHKTSFAYDKELWKAIRNRKTLMGETGFTIKFDGCDKEVWIMNFPYSFGRIYSMVNPTGGLLPMSITRYVLRHKLSKAAEQNDSEQKQYYETL